MVDCGNWNRGGVKTFLPPGERQWWVGGPSKRERRMAWSIMSSRAFEVNEDEDVNFFPESAGKRRLWLFGNQKGLIWREARTRSRAVDRGKEGRLEMGLWGFLGIFLLVFSGRGGVFFFLVGQSQSRGKGWMMLAVSGVMAAPPHPPTPSPGDHLRHVLGSCEEQELSDPLRPPSCCSDTAGC